MWSGYDFLLYVLALALARDAATYPSSFLTPVILLGDLILLSLDDHVLGIAVVLTHSRLALRHAAGAAVASSRSGSPTPVLKLPNDHSLLFFIQNSSNTSWNSKDTPTPNRDICMKIRPNNVQCPI